MSIPTCVLFRYFNRIRKLKIFQIYPRRYKLVYWNQIRWIWSEFQMKIAFMTGGRGRHVSYFNITYIIEQRLLDGTISILLDLHLLAYVASYIAFAIWWFFFLVYDEKRKCLRYTRLFGEKFNIYFRHFYKTRISETVFTITKIEKFGFFSNYFLENIVVRSMAYLEFFYVLHFYYVLTTECFV